MRMMFTAALPNEPFNSLVRSGRRGRSSRHILAELKPEATYFLEDHGTRCAILIIKSPTIADPCLRRAVLPQVQRDLPFSDRNGSRGSRQSRARGARKEVEIVAAARGPRMKRTLKYVAWTLAAMLAVDWRLFWAYQWRRAARDAVDGPRGGLPDPVPAERKRACSAAGGTHRGGRPRPAIRSRARI